MTSILSGARTFDALMDADLERVYQQGKEEVLRDRAFRILLARADRVDKMEKLAFKGEMGLDRWTTKELIEILNHFRLLSSPENIIRLYRQCGDQVFRNAPRVREFYILALNRLGRPAEAIREGSQIIAEGGQNSLLWGTLGESYTARMLFAEKFEKALQESGGDLSPIDSSLISRFPDYFPGVDIADMTIALARALRQENLASATRIFRRGFRESGTSFTGLGWMLRTLDRLADLAVERGRLKKWDQNQPGQADANEALRIRFADSEFHAVEELLNDQAVLIGTALELQGGSESLDYWTHAGTLLLAVLRGDNLGRIQEIIPRVFATADALFKFDTALSELSRVKNQYATVREGELSRGGDTSSLDIRIRNAEFAITECNTARALFKAAGSARGGGLPEKYQQRASGPPSEACHAFLKKTINFRALLGNLVPLHISGGLSRAGSRVPDLVINRQVQEDLADLVETKVSQVLNLKERDNPRAVIAQIQKVVASGLKLEELQDLQSPAHSAFDILSDGLIALSGLDRDMRQKTRTSTDLTSALLTRNGDCRETMYLNGALFACWQQLQVKKRIAKAMLCLELDFPEGFQTIVSKEIPALLRYQLRGGQVAVYVDSMAMDKKYQSKRLSAYDSTAVLRSYSIDELRAGQALTPYELASSVIEVTYVDGSSTWIGLRGKGAASWLPINHIPFSDGGVPLIENAGGNQERIRSIRLLNLVEDHAMTFLYDAESKTAELCDGFYNESLFNSPYRFGSGPINLEEIRTDPGLFRAGSRVAVGPGGSRQERSVYLRFLPFSKTDYEAALVEGDIPGTLQVMGRTFHCDLKRERRRLEEGTSPIPALLEKVRIWELERRKSGIPDRETAERQTAKLILDMAGNQRELVKMKEVTAGQPLLIEGKENENVYLVLTGQMYIYHNGRPLRDHNGVRVTVTAGGVLGEISALNGGPATATAKGNAVVLSISKAAVRQELRSDLAFRESMEKVASYRIF
jgi:Cyclic nucleotide-binding domain